jgi:hypothetical protein
MIKAEIKVSSLLKLHKERHFGFSPTNLVNLLIKVLELRQINTKEQEPEKMLGLLAVVSRKANKFSPEDMVRFLHSIKKVNVLFADFQMLSPFIRLILDEVSILLLSFRHEPMKPIIRPQRGRSNPST